jgi:hypothetical protein
MATARLACYPLPPPDFDADGLQHCRYRVERSVDGEGPGAIEVLCIAMAGQPLGRKGRDGQAIASICNACRIPREAERRPCLYLVPMKIDRDGSPKDYFICRWFYKDRPEAPDESTDWMCGTCPYWFPAPPDAVAGLERVVRRMIDYHQDVWRNPPQRVAMPRASTPPPTTWLRRLVDWVRWWVLPS